MAAYTGEPTKAAILKRLQKKTNKNSLFNPKAKLDTSQVIDLRSELAKMLVPSGIGKRQTPVGLHDFLKNPKPIRRPGTRQ